MTAVTRPLASFNDGQGAIDYTYDDVSLLIQSVHIVNGGARGALTVQIGPPLNQSFTANAQTGMDRVIQLSSFGQHMVMVVGKGGVAAAQLPWDVTCTWAAQGIR